MTKNWIVAFLTSQRLAAIAPFALLFFELYATIMARLSLSRRKLYTML